MDEQIFLYPYYNNKKEQTTDTHIIMDINLKSILLNKWWNTGYQGPCKAQGGQA